ncbi:MAG: Crp/Fnr family transcriptional regulator [Gammaproteobacteria bacterium]|nr:Crp/Fnr family transcriptional regulator [Gammaproteobacteria bacterium]
MLAKISLFEGLSDKEQAVVLEPAVVRVYPKNSVILNEGDPASSLYIIQAGSAKVFLSDRSGRELIVNILNPGDHFGELALIEDSQRTASVMTLERSVFLVLEKQDFLDVLSQYPNIALSLIRYLTHRVKALTEKAKGLAMMDVHTRVSRTLYELAMEEGEELTINRKLTQQEIANRVGASREMVSRIMKDLVGGGYIVLENHHIVLHEKLIRELSLQ